MLLIRCRGRCIDGKYRRGRRGLKNESLYRTTEPASGHRPFSSLRPRAHVRVFAGRRAAMDSKTTRGQRTGCDATLQSVHPGRSACLNLHVRLPALSQPGLLRLLRRPQKEGETPLRNPITGIAGCCARAASGHATAAPPRSVIRRRQAILSPDQFSHQIKWTMFSAHTDEDEVSPIRVSEVGFLYFPTGGVAMSAYADKLVEEYKTRRQEYVSFTQSVRDLLQSQSVGRRAHPDPLAQGIRAARIQRDLLRPRNHHARRQSDQNRARG